MGCIAFGEGVWLLWSSVMVWRCLCVAACNSSSFIPCLRGSNARCRCTPICFPARVAVSFPVFGDSTQSCYEHPHTSICTNICGGRQKAPSPQNAHALPPRLCELLHYMAKGNSADVTRVMDLRKGDHPWVFGCLTPGHHWSSHCLHSVAFSRRLQSWHRTACGLFRLASFTL